MKNIPLLTFLIFFLTTAISQNILPTYEDNPVWEMQFDNYYSYENYSIILQPDTLICGQIWTPVENTNEDIYIAGRIGYFREEGDKVFVRKTENCEEEEFLMFDFSAEIGDTLIIGWGGGNPLYPYEVVVTNKGIITVDGIERRTVSVLYDTFLTPISFWWVEGVGNIDPHAPPLYSLDCSSFICSEAGYIFNCFYENGNLSFNNLLSSQTCEFLIDTLRVNQNLATGNNDGTDWENAFFDLQDAVEIADSSTVILVAQGTYFPTSNNDRTTSFMIPDGVQLYGGFLGNEVNIGDRNFTDNPTVLSGDIGVLGDKSDNSYHVLYALGVDSTTIIDGFIIEKGNADGQPFSSNEAKGGGFLIDTDFSNPKANPVIRNTTFQQNCAGSGGGIYCKGQSNQMALEYIISCSFYRNSAVRDGGGLYRVGGKSNESIIENCIFTENYALIGGGIHLEDYEGKQIINNCLFQKDSALIEGGGIFVVNDEDIFSLEINKSTINENKAGGGGGVALVYAGANPEAQIEIAFDSTNITNNIGGGVYLGSSRGNIAIKVHETNFSDNTGIGGGAGIFIESASNIDLEVERSIFTNNLVLDNSGCGGIYYAGQGNDNFNFFTNVSIKNTIFNGNTDALGFFTGFGGGINLHITNCTFFDNGDRPFWKNWNPDFTDTHYNNWYISNSIIWENSPIEFLFFNNNLDNLTIHDYFINNCMVNVPSCIVDGVNACIEGTIYEENPLFIDSLNDDFRVAACSPAINAGNNAYLQTSDSLDLADMPRIQENIVDMGAYERDSFAIVILEVIDETCTNAMDGEIVVATQGDAPFNFDWQVDTLVGEGLTDLSMGNYFLTILDNFGCSDTVNVVVGGSLPIVIFATIEDASTATVEDGSIFIDSIAGGIEPYSFNWETGDTINFLKNLATGMYNLTITDANGCEEILVFDVSFMSGTATAPITTFDFKLYPNPFKSELHFTWNEYFKPDYLVIYDVLGRVVFEENDLSNQYLKLATLPSGIYFLRIGNEQQHIIQQVVKK